MRVLWIINIPTPAASDLFSLERTPFGGWLDYSSKLVSESEEIKLAIAFPCRNKFCATQKEKNKITYYPFNNQSKLEMSHYASKIIHDFLPDIVHIHGSEFLHSLVFAEKCLEFNVKFVVSIQGLVSIYSKHYFAGLDFKTIHFGTFRDFIKMDRIIDQKRKYVKRGISEQELLRLSKFVMGRTDWDKACVLGINDKIKYYNCNEILRQSFYDFSSVWKIENCQKYNLFVSQGNYPIKGLHYLLEAILLVIKDFPDLTLNIAGDNLLNMKRPQFLRGTSYSCYIQKYLKKNNIEGKVKFLGKLDEKEMKRYLINSHAFISPSTIENSSNSICEAMILGIPVISSFVGGTSSIITNRVDGYLYQHDAPYMLAYYIKKVISDDTATFNISKNSQEIAYQRHNPMHNCKRILEIYNDIKLDVGE